MQKKKKKYLQLKSSYAKVIVIGPLLSSSLENYFFPNKVNVSKWEGERFHY